MYLSSLAFALWICFISIAAAAKADHLKPIFGRPTPKKPVHISPELYRKFQVYTNYTAATYQPRGHCPNPPYNSEILNYISTLITDSQAVIFRDDERKLLVIAFPGTSSRRDLHTDSRVRLARMRIAGVNDKKCRGCRAHVGIQKAWNSMLPTVRLALNNHTKRYPSYKVGIAGHSLGGALATLAYVSLKGLNYPVKEAVTLGAMRVANQHLADYVDKISGATENKSGEFYRVTHENDAVPGVPGGRYVNPRTEYWELNTKDGGQSAQRTFRCFGQDPPNCNAGTKSKTIINKSHGMYSGIDMHGRQSCGV